MGTYTLRVPASRVGYVPDAQGGLPQGPTYCTYGVRVPASGVGYVPRTVAPQVPWTSGSIGGKTDLTTKWQTGGGWGNMRIHQLGADGTPIEASCTRNQGRECDPKVLGHAG